MTPTTGGRLLLPTLTVLFVLSGAAGLIYESIWARYLGLLVGHSAYAQILVLGIFLGGMALGAAAIGSRSRRLVDPLRWYAYVELAVGLIGLVFHDLYQSGAGLAYNRLFPALAGTAAVTIAKWVVAALLILPQSVLLGTTFPLMGAGVLRRLPARAGRVLGLLYFANSLGAAGGVLLAGFWLLAVAGLPGTVLVAAITNLLVGLGALGVASRHTPLPAAESTERADPAAPTTSSDVGLLSREQVWRVLLALSFGTAVASFIYEISWLRMLSLVLGSATHSFELMLSAFILGLALGSLWIRSRADQSTRPIRTLGVVQWVMGFTALATVPLYEASFGWMAHLLRAFTPTDAGYNGFTLARYAICLAVMLPSTFCAGITLPLITRTLLVRGAGERAIGAVYGINTVGSIAGVVLAGLILFPVIGMQWTLVGGATIDMVLGVALLALSVSPARRAWRLSGAGAALTLAVAGAIGALSRVDARVLSSGVFRSGRVPPPQSVDVRFYADGRTATVAAVHYVATDQLSISTNGKADGSLPGWWFQPCADSIPRRPLIGDAATQVLLPLVTAAHVPGARRAAVIGHGTGVSSHILLASPALERLVTIEIEPEMLAGSRAFHPANQRVFEDPRSAFVLQDARAYLAAAGEQFDLILSEPSNPWVSGVSSLFTREFYRHVRRHVGPGGVFGQWIHRTQLTDGLILSVLAALHEHFPSYQMFETNDNDLLVVAGLGPELPRPDWSVTTWPALAGDLCRVLPLTADVLEATRLLDRAALAPLLGGWQQPNSDFYPVLDLGAERARYLSRRADGFGDLAAARFDPTAPFAERRLAPRSGPLIPIYGARRLTALALGAALRGAPAPGGVDPSALPPGLEGVVFRHRVWEQLLGSDIAPGSWPVWFANFRAMDRDRHGGTAGFVDAGYYQSVERYLRRHAAPAEIHDAVAFFKGLAAWDFGAAAAAAERLAPLVAEDGFWIDPDEFVEGAVVAKLRTGDVAGARRLHELLAHRRRAAGELPGRLVDAYLSASADGGAR